MAEVLEAADLRRASGSPLQRRWRFRRSHEGGGVLVKGQQVGHRGGVPLCRRTVTVMLYLPFRLGNTIYLYSNSTLYST